MFCEPIRIKANESCFGLMNSLFCIEIEKRVKKGLSNVIVFCSRIYIFLSEKVSRPLHIISIVFMINEIDIGLNDLSLYANMILRDPDNQN